MHCNAMHCIAIKCMYTNSCTTVAPSLQVSAAQPTQHLASHRFNILWIPDPFYHLSTLKENFKPSKNTASCFMFHPLPTPHKGGITTSFVPTVCCFVPFQERNDKQPRVWVATCLHDSINIQELHELRLNFLWDFLVGFPCWFQME